jgi:hypothetical protein
MGGWDFVRSTQALNKLVARPSHWKGTRIAVKATGMLEDEVQATVYEDGIITHCTHTHVDSEIITANPGLDDEYNIEAFVCQKCGMGWDRDGEKMVDPYEN